MIASAARSLFRPGLFAAAALCAGSVFAGMPYDKWAGLQGLSGAKAEPTANPDGDRFPNALEYAFGTNPLKAEKNYAVAPGLEAEGDKMRFVYRVHGQSEGVATFRVLTSRNTRAWMTAPGIVEAIATDGATNTYALEVPVDSKDAFYQLEVTVPYGSASIEPDGGEPRSLLGKSPSLAAVITIGSNIGGSSWDALGGNTTITSVVLRTEPPAVANGPDAGKPDLSKYPKAAGANQVSFTEWAFKDYETAGLRPPRRSWMGFFLWGNGTPPPGVSAGYPVTNNYNPASKLWDYFGFFRDPDKPDEGDWQPIRMDQQPLYLNPLTINYTWPPGPFGYVTKPLKPFESALHYWADKQIVRGMNISQQTPYFYPYSNVYTIKDLPPVWMNSWFYVSSRPLESIVIVPGNLSPTEVLENGPWNDIGASNPQGLARYQPFPYPVWDTTSLAAKDQTPFNIQVDRVGDFDADLIWEGTNPQATGYAKNRYQRTPFDKPGIGNYLKATVAQGSPFVWCETNNASYATFYNLTRQNMKGSITTQNGNEARMVPGGPWPVEGVSGVSFVLIYANASNPNQYFQEVAPLYSPDPTTGAPGGFNPAGSQQNYTFTAVYYRTSSVRTVRIGPDNGTNANNGIDAQGNPYFYLEFNDSKKNWFVVGSVPTMRYYAPGVPLDETGLLVQAAKDWAQQMGKYAFNFPVGSKITYSVKNMYQADTTHTMSFTNPYVAANVPGASSMTVDPNKTVMALKPHHYQPLTLGPDLTRADRKPVKWSPLRTAGIDFPTPASAPPNANKSTAKSPSRWDYWTVSGNLKSVITGSFTTAYPFQNFLPVMPPPDWKRKFEVNGVLAANITNVGVGNANVVEPPSVTIEQLPLAGSGATFEAVMIPSNPPGQPTGVQTVTVKTPGSGYVRGGGLPPSSASVATLALFDLPPSGNESDRAQANVFVNDDGTIKSVEVSKSGSGYTSPPNITLVSPSIGAGGATFDVTVDVNTSGLQTIVPKNQGTGYPAGLPAPVKVKIADPTSPPPSRGGVTAEAVAQIGGDGKVLAIFIEKGGFGYSPTITVEQDGVTDPPVIIPNFANNSVQGSPLIAGAAQVRQAGSGLDYSKPYTVKLNSTGTTPATVELVRPGIINNVAQTSQWTAGVYPSSGNKTLDAARIQVNIAPPAVGAPAQTAKLTENGIVPLPGVTIFAVKPGAGYSSSPTGQFSDGKGNTYQVAANYGGAGNGVIALGAITPVGGAPATPQLDAPQPVTFSGGGTPTTTANGTVYPAFQINSNGIVLDGASVAGYVEDADISLSGGEIEPAGVKLPGIQFSFTPTGELDPATLKVDPANPGEGWTQPGAFTIEGGRGFDAVLQPVMSTSTGGSILGVKVMRKGAGYLNPTKNPDGSLQPRVFANIPGGNGGAELSVVVVDGSISEVKVAPGKGGSFSTVPNIILTSKDGSINPAVDDPRGPKALVSYTANGTGGIAIDKIENAGGGYVPGSESTILPNSPQAYVQFQSQYAPGAPGSLPLALPSVRANGLLARISNAAETEVQRAMYDSMVSYYSTNFASKNLMPYGQAYLGASAPDGYGLGGSLEAGARFASDLFNFQQYVAAGSPDPANPADSPDFAPSTYAINAASTGEESFALPSLKANSPLFSLSSGLKASVQSLQWAITLLFNNEISSNKPIPDSKTGLLNTWNLDYFSSFDDSVGRVVVNPTGGNPGYGSVSSVVDPPQPADNEKMEAANQWKKGQMWVGFGVSDQWNDQHYFYGYYLGSAALAGILDQSWLPTADTLAKPANLWAGPNQMGPAIDQWMMSVAYDPDNAALNRDLYKIPGLSYQKFAFFDQWNGHSWATGIPPNAGGNTIDKDPKSYGNWSAFGTGSGQYLQENENSIIEGLQAWSATVLWGGATDRKSVVDMGIYLMATTMAAGDLYFLDKNHNLSIASNANSWVPVTTIDSGKVPVNGGTYVPAGTDYAGAAPEAFYTPYSPFGPAASPGVSLLKKGEISINNFFLGYPLGSKLIEAFPPTPWTMAISRNNDYMRSWAGALMRDEWKQLVDMKSSRFNSPPDFLALAMTSALSGVPYTPGDLPYAKDGTPANPPLPPYVDRLWSNWVSPTAPLGTQVTLKPYINQVSVVSFLLALDKYGTPDWTYIAKVTDATGADKDDSILFTAVFSKVVGNKAVTTFVAFNPGWEARYAQFYRLASDGTPATTPIELYPSKPDGKALVKVDPKRMVTITLSFDIVP